MKLENFIQCLYNRGWENTHDAQHVSIKKLWEKLFPEEAELTKIIKDLEEKIEGLSVKEAPKKQYKLSKRSLSRLEGIDTTLLEILIVGIKYSPYDFGIPTDGGRRSDDDQNRMYLIGASQLDGYINKSYHQTGKAFDIYLYINGKASWDIDKLEKVAKHLIMIAKAFNVELTWGGDWNGNGIRVDKDKKESFLDGGHFQWSKSWKRLKP